MQYFDSKTILLVLVVSSLGSLILIKRIFIGKAESKFVPDPLPRNNSFTSVAAFHATQAQELPSSENDLGFDFNENSSDHDINAAIKRIEKEFSLVVITEYFDESLILFKRKFNLTMKDILYIKMKVRKTRDVIDDERIINKIREWNKADFALYRYFNQTLWKLIAVEDATYIDEVKEFKYRVGQMSKLCFSDVSTKEKLKIDVHYNNEFCSAVKRDVGSNTKLQRIKMKHLFDTLGLNSE